jgi:hypothetical protein
LLIRENRNIIILKNKKSVVITVTSIVILLAFSSVYSNFDVIQAFAGETLSSDNVAKTILVRINPTGTNIEKSFDSFSRIGFVAGEGNFLLESIPSKDKKPFYSLVKKSMDTKGNNLKNSGMNIAIDIFSGNGEIIETLIYNNCKVTEYFVHGIDSRGKIFFVENEGTVEIREVTKFACVSLTLEINYTEKEIDAIEKTIEIVDASNKFEHDNGDVYFSVPSTNGTEGELFYNSNTNKLQKFENGKWVDISRAGGPPAPRK